MNQKAVPAPEKPKKTTDTLQKKTVKPPTFKKPERITTKNKEFVVKDQKPAKEGIKQQNA